MTQVIDTEVLRLVGPDGKVCAVFEAKANGGCHIQIGNPEHDGGIMLLAEENGNCSISVASGTGYSRFTIDARNTTSTVSFRNAEDKVVLTIAGEQDGCVISLMDAQGHIRLALSVEEDNQPVIEAVHKNGQKRKIL